MSKRHWNMIAQTAVLTVAMACLLLAVLQNNQAMLSAPIHQAFSGEYSQNGGPWLPLTEDAPLPAFRGDLVLRGHFDYAVPEGARLNVHLNHIGYSIRINGELYMENTVMELTEMGRRLFPSVCGRSWYYLISPGITPEDEIEIHLHNPHRFGNGSAFRDFLDTLYISPNVSTIMDSYLKPYNQPFQIAGWSVIITALMLLGAAVAASAMRSHSSGRLWKFSLLLLFAGGYMIFDCAGFFEDRLLVLSTYGRQLCMMLFALWLVFCAVDSLTARAGKVARTAAALSLLLDSVLITLSLFGAMLIYDTLFFWVVSQLLLCPVLLGCCVDELRRGSREQLALWSCMVLLISIPLDLLGVGESVYSRGTCTKTVFILLVVVHIVRALIHVLTDQQMAARAKELETELEDSRIAVMVSQMQPHFLYNALGAIRDLCGPDSRRARDAIDDFTIYLRGNVDALNYWGLIPFARELEHIETYLNLEKLRFGDKLRVEYDIQAVDFDVPALTVQPIVENAVRHGIGGVSRPGTVTLRTACTESGVEIVVTDDGAGFEPGAAPPEDGRSHVGLANIRSRLEKMAGGRLLLQSAPGQGTTVTILLTGKEERKFETL